MKLSLIVPCFNEQDNIYAFYDAVKEAFYDKITNYEIIYINDGSRDNTWKKMKQLYKERQGKDCNLKLINFSRNFGKESAMYAGLNKAVGEYVCIIDADLQQRPEIVVDMIKFLDDNEDYDSIAAYQSERKESKLQSFFKKRFYKLINKLGDTDFRENASDFRTFRRKVAEAILDLPEYYRFSKGLFSWVGFKTHYVPYEVAERFSGETKWTTRKLFKYASEGIVSFSVFPLKIAKWIGAVSATASLIYMIVVIIQTSVFGIAVPGYATIVVLLLLLGGLQFIIMGIIGSYIARIYIQGKNRPIYIEKEYISQDENEEE